MDILNANQKPWKEIKEIYIEAFPKSERKPFFTVRRSVNKGKALLLTAMENEALRGFVLVIPYKNMVMVDYLAVSSKTRSRGTGSKIMQEVCRYFPGKKIVLLIERPDDTAENKDSGLPAGDFISKTASPPQIFISPGAAEIWKF